MALFFLAMASLAAPLHVEAADTGGAMPLPAPGAFKLKASNGYSVFVAGVPAHKSFPPSIAMFVTRKQSGAFYVTPATVTETSMQADLGALGKIEVTFHPLGQPETARSECGGKSVTFDSGFYEGTISFHGEGGYTEVEAVGARGSLGFLLDVICPGISGSRGGSLPGAELDAYADGTRRGPHLTVVKNRPAAPVRLEASMEEEGEGVSIYRYVSTIASAKAFEYDGKVQSALVHPPTPFSGVAHFRRAKPVNRWYGNLRVDFPGRLNARLTGPHDRASLAHAHWSWH
jgi:hypothetical protein